MELSRDKIKEIINDDWLLMDDCEGNKNCDVVKELARIALASLEAEPAIHRCRRVTVEPYGPYPWHYGNFIGFSKPVEGIEDEYFYSAPPAPVSVPAAMEMDDDFDSAFEHGKAVGWNAYRAAMLQGSKPVEKEYRLPESFDFDRFNDLVWLEAVASNPHMHSPTTSTIAMVALELNRKLAAGNSPVIPDGWVACSERMPEQFKAILAFNEYGEVWSGAYDRYWNFYCDNLLVEHVTHWMPLPAAPQQEVK